MSFLSWTGSLSAGLFFALGASPAGAEPSAAEIASARDMFNEARRAEDAGQWAEALVKLKAVANVKVTPQVRFHLGLCQEHTGQLVDALNNFERAHAEASEQKLPTVMEEARQHAGQVRARVPKLTIVLPTGTTDGKVEIDGQAVASVLLGRPLPVDPGSHKIIARAPGRVFSGQMSFIEAEEKRLDVIFTPVSQGDPAPAPPPLETGKGAATSATLLAATTADVAPRPSSPSNSPSTLGWIAVGSGGALLAGAAVSALARKSATDQIEEDCPSHQRCPRSLEDSQSKARTFGTAAVALGAVGGGALVTGLIMLLLPSSSSKTTAGLTLAPWVDGRTAGVVGAASW